MIFHGVYTTPQQIDSTLSTTSNNAVNGQAVAEYVSAKIICEITDESDATSITSPKAVADYVNAKIDVIPSGSPTPVFRQNVFTASDKFYILASYALICGNVVQIYFEARAKDVTVVGTNVDVDIGTLVSDMPTSPFSVVTHSHQSSSAFVRPQFIALMGDVLRVKRQEVEITLEANDTFQASLVYCFQ
jgi:hypothetical protein